MKNNQIGYGIIGTPRGFQSLAKGIISDQELINIVDLDNNEISVTEGSEVLGIIKEKSGNDVFTYFLLYRYAREIDRIRSGGFYGSVVALKNHTATPEAVYALLVELATNVKLYIDGNTHQYLSNFDSINFKKPDNLLLIEKTLQPISWESRESQKPIFVRLSTTKNERFAFFYEAIHHPEFKSFNRLYASEFIDVENAVKEKRALDRFELKSDYTSITETLVADAKKLEEKKSSILGAISIQETKLENLKKENLKIEKENESILEAKRNKDILLNEIDTLTKKKKGFNDEISDILSSIDKRKQEREKIEDSISSKKTEINSIDKKISTKSSHLKEIERKIEGKQSSLNELKGLDDKLLEKEKALGKLQNKIDDERERQMDEKERQGIFQKFKRWVLPILGLFGIVFFVFYMTSGKPSDDINQQPPDNIPSDIVEQQPVETSSPKNIDNLSINKIEESAQTESINSQGGEIKKIEEEIQFQEPYDDGKNKLLKEVEDYLASVKRNKYDDSLNKYIKRMKNLGLQNEDTYSDAMKMYRDWRRLGYPSYKIERQNITAIPGKGISAIIDEVFLNNQEKIAPEFKKEKCKKWIIRFNKRDVNSDGTINNPDSKILVYYPIK